MNPAKLDPIPGPALETSIPEDRGISPSMLGCASTVYDDDPTQDIDMDDEDASIQHLYRAVRAQDPIAVILGEKVDQKDTLLMEGMLCPDEPLPDVVLTDSMQSPYATASKRSQ